jgi:gamma-glutamyltranspeptidase / glutathione hydrolase
LLRSASPNFREMLKEDSSALDGCRSPGAGETLRNPTLANTFRLLGKHGKDGFYKGPVAEALIKVVSDLGGGLTLADLEHHAEVGSEEVDAISLQYSGQGLHEPLEVWEHPPNGQGIVALMALGMLQELEKSGKIRKWEPKDHNSAE